MPGQSDAVSFSGNTNQSSPPLSGSGPPGSQPGSLIPGPGASPAPSPVTNNAFNFQIGGTGICGQFGSVNQPCASVTVCVPGTSDCQTISDLLVDTGSYGLRIFSAAISLPLTQLQDNSGRALAECAQFGTGADWGPVMQASVQLGGEQGVVMPIQVINSTYAGGPPSVAVSAGCTGIDTSPQQAGFNGILGIGLFTQDCGAECNADSTNGLYFGCSGGNCSGAAVSVANQVVNPVSMLLSDNNGLVFALAGILSAGSAAVDGTVTLGIGTQSDNMPSGTEKTYLADATGNLTTDFNGGSYPASFIDSGSNGLFFPAPTSLPACASNSAAPGWFCPATTTAFTATNLAASGGVSGSVSFSIANSVTLVGSGNAGFDDLGADSSSSGFSNSFDWGLPFFYGKTVYIGISGARSTLGSGPYWAY